MLRSYRLLLLALCVAAPCHAADARAFASHIRTDASDILGEIYSFDLDAAAESARKMQRDEPEHPLGYLLEAEALWWRIWCISADFKWGMVDARHRPKLAADQHYFQLGAKAYALARARIESDDSAEMQFYAGMADAQAARLYALRGENRATARVGVRARQSFLHALELDPGLADANLGLGLYNYYVDTLSSIAKMLRFFMGIPGGSKQEGLRQLERAAASGTLTPTAARIYLALNLHRYDQQYARAIKFLDPVAEKYPSNPLFQLMLGDLQAKLGHRDKALARYRAAGELPVVDAECRARIHALVRSATSGLSSADPSRKQ